MQLCQMPQETKALQESGDAAIAKSETNEQVKASISKQNNAITQNNSLVGIAPGFCLFLSQKKKWWIVWCNRMNCWQSVQQMMMPWKLFFHQIWSFKNWLLCNCKCFRTQMLVLLKKSVWASSSAHEWCNMVGMMCESHSWAQNSDGHHSNAKWENTAKVKHWVQKQWHLWNVRLQKSSRVLTMFAEATEKLMKIFNKQVKEVSSSSEDVANWIAHQMFPWCVKNLLKKVGKDKEQMAKHNWLLSTLDLKSLSWLKHSRFAQYNENKQCCRTANHEREGRCSQRHQRWKVTGLFAGHKWPKRKVKCWRTWSLAFLKTVVTPIPLLELLQFIPDSDEKCGGSLSVRKKQTNVNQWWQRERQICSPAVCVLWKAMKGAKRKKHHAHTWRSCWNAHMALSCKSSKFGLGLNLPSTPVIQDEVNEQRHQNLHKPKDAAQISHDAEEKMMWQTVLASIFSLLEPISKDFVIKSCKVAIGRHFGVSTKMHPGFDFLFLFDQSLGHAKMREGSLDVRDMNES